MFDLYIVLTCILVGMIGSPLFRKQGRGKNIGWGQHRGCKQGHFMQNKKVEKRKAVVLFSL